VSKNKSTSIFASVVFLKVQEFARRPVTEQARMRAQLDAVVAVTTAELAPASRIVLEASDGIAVVVLADPAGALRLAERAMAAVAAGLPLSVGINHGAVQTMRSDGMVGDGIAVAVLLAAGVAGRVSKVGQESFVEGMLAAYRDTAAQGEKYVRSLVQKVKF